MLTSCAAFCWGLSGLPQTVCKQTVYPLRACTLVIIKKALRDTRRTLLLRGSTCVWKNAAAFLSQRPFNAGRTLQINARSQGGVLNVRAVPLAPVGELSESSLYISASSVNALIIYHIYFITII